MNLYLRLPRFQFFYSTPVLFLFAFKLLFSSKNKTEKKHLFLNEMKKMFGRKHAQIVSSYRIGLYLTLKSLNLEKGSEVLLSPITIADTVNAIYLAGLNPVFVEMDPETHCLDLSEISKKTNAKTKVLLVTYLSGIVPDILSLQKLCLDNKLLLIEDFSQNIDADYKNKKIGSHGDVSIASLSCGKNLSSLYGGLILTDRADIIERIKSLANELELPPNKSVLFYYLLNCIKVQVATNRILFPIIVFPALQTFSFFTKKFPLDPDHDPLVHRNIFQSSRPSLRMNFPKNFFIPIINWQFEFMEHQLKKLRSGTLKRRHLARVLIKNLSAKSLHQVPKGLHNYDENSYYHFPIKCNGRKVELRKHLFQNGIDNGSYGLNLCSEEQAFPLAMPLQASHKIKHDTLFLPLHESYTEAHMQHIAMTVNSYFENF